MKSSKTMLVGMLIVLAGLAVWLPPIVTLLFPLLSAIAPKTPLPASNGHGYEIHIEIALSIISGIIALIGIAVMLFGYRRKER